MFILLSVCLMGSPQTCREERISWSVESSNSLQCLLSAQQMIAKWHEGHSNWEIRRWRCVPRERLSTDI